MCSLVPGVDGMPPLDPGSASLILAVFHGRGDDAGELGVDDGSGMGRSLDLDAAGADDAGAVVGAILAKDMVLDPDAAGADDGRMILGVVEGPCSHVASVTPTLGSSTSSFFSTSSFLPKDMGADMAAERAAMICGEILGCGRRSV